MKILVATDKPFAAVAVEGIRKEVEAAGIELVLLEKYGDKANLLEAVKDVDGLIVRSDIIDAEVIEAAKNLNRFSRGYRTQCMCDEYSGTELKCRCRIGIRYDGHDGS